MNDILRLAEDIEKAAAQAPEKVGAVLGAHVDRVRDTARANIASNLSPRFTRGIISRRERSGGPAGYVLAAGEILGPVVRAWERGTANHGPRPSIIPAAEKHEPELQKRLGEIGGLG